MTSGAGGLVLLAHGAPAVASADQQQQPFLVSFSFSLAHDGV